MLQHAALQGRPAPPVGSRLRAAPAAAHQRSLVVRPAAQKETVSSALESLDALLSDGEEQQPRGAAKVGDASVGTFLQGWLAGAPALLAGLAP